MTPEPLRERLCEVGEWSARSLATITHFTHSFLSMRLHLNSSGLDERPRAVDLAALRKRKDVDGENDGGAGSLVRESSPRMLIA